jgi:transposase-like protein
MPESYSQTVKDRARELYLRGGLTFAQIAADPGVGVARPDTIRDWARAHRWVDLKGVVDRLADARSAANAAKDRDELRAKHDGLGELVEAIAIRLLRTRRPDGAPDVSAADLASCARAIALAQNVRRRARGLDSPNAPAEVPSGPTTIVFQPAVPPYPARGPNHPAAEDTPPAS